MFAAMCENPEFYRERMNLFVAIAPAIFLSQMNSMVLQNLKNDKVVCADFRMKFPESDWKRFASAAVNEFTK